MKMVKPIIIQKLSPYEAALETKFFNYLTDKMRPDPNWVFYRVSYVFDPSYSRQLVGKPNNPYAFLREYDRREVFVHQ